MTQSWLKYLHPTPRSPDHSSCRALGERSTGANASSLIQPSTFWSASTYPTASDVPMAMPSMLPSPVLMAPASAVTSPSLATTMGTSPISAAARS